MSPFRPDLVDCWMYRVAAGRGTRGAAAAPCAGPDPARPVAVRVGLARAGRARRRWARCASSRRRPGSTPTDIEAFYDLDLVNQFHEPSVDAVVTAAVFAVRVRPDAEPRLSHEHDDARWLPLDEAHRRSSGRATGRRSSGSATTCATRSGRAGSSSSSTAGGADRGPRSEVGRRVDSGSGRQRTGGRHRWRQRTTEPDDRARATPRRAAASSARRSTRIRPTYGFEDVSLAPGTETVEPADVDLDPDVLRHRARRSRSSPPRWTPSSTSGSPARWPGSAGSPSSTSRASRPATTTPTRSSSGIATAPDDEVQDLLAEAYASRSARTSSPPHRGDPRRRLEGRRRGDARRRPRFGPFCAEHGADLFLVQSPGHRRPPPRDRLRPAVPRRVHPVHADPGRGRQHDERRGRLSS